MKITIIAPFTFGYIEALVAELAAKPSVEVTLINTGEFRFKYQSVFERVYNVYLKVIKSKNLKIQFQSREIVKILNEQPPQDIIMVIRPDKLERSLLGTLRKYSSKLISYYFDSVSNFPQKIKLIPLFDEVYSYDKEDAQKYNLKFITNYIPYDSSGSKEVSGGVFNISSYDRRFPVLVTLANQLKQMNYPFKFIVRKEKLIKVPDIEIVKEYIPLTEVKKLIEEAEVLLDIQKENQMGLSFRVFEALGYDKKLITTNQDIKTYDFYDSDNILVLDKENLQIPESFLKKQYKEVPEKIKEKYRRKAWSKEVFGI
ncbi:hypothetical protein LZ575_06385 [Antarcticibacterium sp. 1MA-6-2]|uniref:hypothetical protein n=1 Tax=Antarcticibacterium sp. 1MA-6-2 TaxID=2908210 RepID=UPI001F2C1217|nr:hypothetical protein [Antarcticibacterium sp. 1MA-6-2]UJH92197.1 hypothetical protein LZ575_06385 [Antarcticibacterium sp. 1MA-6-2]